MLMAFAMVFGLAPAVSLANVGDINMNPLDPVLRPVAQTVFGIAETEVGGVLTSSWVDSDEPLSTTARFTLSSFAQIQDFVNYLANHPNIVERYRHGSGDWISWSGFYRTAGGEDVRIGVGGGSQYNWDWDTGASVFVGFFMNITVYINRVDTSWVNPALRTHVDALVDFITGEFDDAWLQEFTCCCYADNPFVFFMHFENISSSDVSEMVAYLTSSARGFTMKESGELPTDGDIVSFWTGFRDADDIGVSIVYHTCCCGPDVAFIGFWRIDPALRSRLHPDLVPWVNDISATVNDMFSNASLISFAECCCYRDEPVSYRITKGFSGISLAGVQSFIQRLMAEGFVQDWTWSNTNNGFTRITWEGHSQNIEIFVGNGVGVGDAMAPLAANAATAGSYVGIQPMDGWTGGFLNNGLTIRLELRSDMCDCQYCAPGVAEDFFYIINFADETISFGHQFNFARLNQETLEPIRVGGSAVMVPAYRHQISFIFNRRYDRIRMDRGNWQITDSGTVDISRHLSRGGYIGVKRTVRGQHEMIALIELPARANHRDIRGYRREIFVPTIFTNNAVVPQNVLRNPSGEHIEIRIGDDRRFRNRPPIATERLAPGASHAFNHDRIPRGTRATFRIAATEQNNFAMFDGEYTCVRFLLLIGETYDDFGNALNLGTGNFASNAVRFRIPNQPTAPPVGRMQIIDGRNGAANFISRTTQHMHVKLGYTPAGEQVWAPLGRNVTVQYVIALFEAFPYGGLHNMRFGMNYELEIRIFRDGRIISAPGFLRVVSSELYDAARVSATIAPLTVEGVVNTALPANGINMIITTTGGVVNLTPTAINATNRACVADWFGWWPGLPDGVQATLTRVQGARATVTFHGTPTEIFGQNLHIYIPHTAVGGTQGVNVQGTLRFNITAAAAAASDTLVSPFSYGYYPADDAIYYVYDAVIDADDDADAYAGGDY